MGHHWKEKNDSICTKITWWSIMSCRFPPILSFTVQRAMVVPLGSWPPNLAHGPHDLSDLRHAGPVDSPPRFEHLAGRQCRNPRRPHS